MPKLEYFLLSKSVSVDSGSSSVSAFHIMRSVSVPRDESFIFETFMVAGLTFSPDEVASQLVCKLRFFIDPPGDEEGQWFDSDLVAGSRFQTLTYGVRRIPVHDSGDMRVELHLDGNVLASHVVEVKLESDDE